MLQYAISNTRFGVNVAFVLTLLAWFTQELVIREHYSEGLFPRANRFMDILAVGMGAFVTGYIFHWVVGHMPKMRVDYERDVDIERDLSSILSNYFHLHTLLLRDIPRDRSITANIFDRFYSTEPHKIVEQMVSIKVVRETGSDFPYTLDPYYYSFDTWRAQITLTVENMYKDRQEINGWLRGLVDYANERLQEDISNEMRDEDLRIKHFTDLNWIVNDFYRYSKENAMEGRIITPFLLDAINNGSYQSVWDEIERDKMDMAKEISAKSQKDLDIEQKEWSEAIADAVNGADDTTNNH
ncbi:MAG: hypothetical protein JNJ91_10610 [Flavobacteriales bacterium]|nr:hypothetical protein [Flavobacteriales bacterium]